MSHIHSILYKLQHVTFIIKSLLLAEAVELQSGASQDSYLQLVEIYARICLSV